MKHIIFIIFFAISTLAFSQGLRVDAGGNIIVQNTANVIITGNVNWTNNGTANCIAGSWVRFAGNAAQIIQGTNTTAPSISPELLEKLEISNETRKQIKEYYNNL